MKTEWTAQTFAMAFPTVFTLLYFVVLPGPELKGSDLAHLGGDLKPPNRVMQATYAVSKVIQFGFPVAYLYLIGAFVFKVRPPSFAGLGWGLGFGLLTVALMLAVYQTPLRDVFLAADTRALVRNKVDELLGGATPLRFLVFAAFLSVVHSLLEEYYWRWFVFGRLRALVPLWLAIALSSLAFMSHHVIVLYVYLPGHVWTSVVPFSLGIAVGGAAWAWLYHRTGSIYSPWLSHAIVDLGIMGLGYEMLFQ